MKSTFTLQGFQPRIVKGVALTVNDRVQVDATLTTGGVSEVVEVTGRTLVQTTTAVQNADRLAAGAGAADQQPQFRQARRAGAGRVERSVR